MMPVTAPEPMYVRKAIEGFLQHNSKTKDALSLLDDNPALALAMRRDLLENIRSAIIEEIGRQSVAMSERMLKYGVHMCPEIAAVWLSDQLEQSAAHITEYYAGIALAGEDSQANIMRACGLRQQSFLTHFPQIENVREAKKTADSTGEPVELTLGGVRTGTGETDLDRFTVR